MRSRLHLYTLTAGSSSLPRCITRQVVCPRPAFSSPADSLAVWPRSPRLPSCSVLDRRRVMLGWQFILAACAQCIYPAGCSSSACRRVLLSSAARAVVLAAMHLPGKHAQNCLPRMQSTIHLDFTGNMHAPS